MNTLVFINVSLLAVLLALLAYGLIFEKFIKKAKVVYVLNRQTDDGENITVQIAIPESFNEFEKFEDICSALRPVEMRQRHNVTVFEELIEQEKAKQAKTTDLKSV